MTKKTFTTIVAVLAVIIGLTIYGIRTELKDLDEKLEATESQELTIEDLSPDLALVCIEKLYGLDNPRALNPVEKNEVMECYLKQSESFYVTMITMGVIEDLGDDKPVKPLLQAIVIVCHEDNKLKSGYDFVAIDKCIDEGMTALEEAVDVEKFKQGV